VTDQPHAARLERGSRLPARKQILDDREQLLLGWIPGLQQVVVERDLVDRLDRRLGVGVGGQQHALGRRHDLARAHEVVGAGEARHALIGDEQGDLLAASHELGEDLETPLARVRSDDPVALAEPAPQVARHCCQHRGLVVDDDDRGAAAGMLRHGVCAKLGKRRGPAIGRSPAAGPSAR
jgi:hypothetical protein